MIEAISIIVSALSGGAITYLILRPKLAHLARLTDRDERGRFVKRER